MKQADLDLASAAEARYERDKALAQVAENAMPYTKQAAQLIDRLNPGTDWTGEDIRIYIEGKIGKPHHHNAWGAIINSAVRRKTLIKTNQYRQMKTPKSHARATPVYVRAL